MTVVAKPLFLAIVLLLGVGLQFPSPPAHESYLESFVTDLGQDFYRFG